MNLDYVLQSAGRHADLAEAREIVQRFDDAKRRAAIDPSDANVEARFQAERSVIRMAASFTGRTLTGREPFHVGLTHNGYRQFRVNPGGTADGSQLVESFSGDGFLNAKVVHVGEPRGATLAPAPKARPAATARPATVDVEPALSVDLDAALKGKPGDLEFARKVIRKYDAVKRAAAADWSAKNRAALHEAERVVITLAEHSTGASLDGGKAFAVALNLGGPRRFVVIPATGTADGSWLLEYRAGERVHVGPCLGETRTRPMRTL